MPTNKIDGNVYIAIDFETSGREGHSACALGLARFEGGVLTDEYYTLIRPPSNKIWFSHIHGLYWKDLKDAPSFPEIWEKAEKFMKGAHYLTAHFASFDRRILSKCCEYYECALPTLDFLCTHKGAKRALAIEAYNLQAVCDYFGFDLQHHNAMSDARNCGRILCKLLKMGLEPGDMLLG